MELTTISIVVPVYNIAPYLPRCLDSILAQTHEAIEVIGVDDGSTDDSGTILDQYAEKDSRVKVIHKKNGGVSAARADGIAAATGEYIGFVDGDDVIEPTMYARLLENLQEYHADIAHCGHRVVYSDGRERYFYNTGRLAKQDTSAALQALLTGAIEPGLCNKLYKASLLHSLFHQGLLANDVRINEDLLINFYAFSEANVLIHEDICPYHYMKREGSASMAALNPHRVHDPITVKHRILERCMGTPLENTARAALLETYIHTYNNLLRTTDPQFDEDRITVRAAVKDRVADARLLGKKYALFARMIARTPRLYRIIYAVYAR